MSKYTETLNTRNRENTLFYDFKNIAEKSTNPNEKYLGPNVKYKDLGELDTRCIPIAHYTENGELRVVFSREPTHCLGIGCTGAGKTTSLVIPKVNILSSLKTRPSFFIIDVKGELHNKLSGHLKSKGYTIKVLDLNQPEFSPSWNPFSELYDKYVGAHKLVSMVVEHQDSIDDYPHLSKFSFTKSTNTWYELDGMAYPSISSLNKGISHIREKMLSEVSEDIRDLAYMFIKTQKKDDPHWDDTARDLFVAVIMGLLERSVIGGKTQVTRDQFNLRTILSLLISSNDDQLRDFIENGDHSLEAYRYANKIVNMRAETTKSCYFGTLSTQLSQFKSYAIQKVTLKNSIDLSTLADRPEAIFLKMDDLKQANYSLAQLIILRLYQQLKKKAQGEPDLTLSRPVHFILDEFGNFPAFNNFGNMISVSRSYNIWYTMVVQSYSQLDMKYGEEVAKIIIENSNMQMFFGTNDFKTKKNFSEACGEITRISEKAFLDGNTSNIAQYPIEVYKTVPVSELTIIDTSEVFITCFRMPVMHSIMERYYLVKEFEPLPRVDYRVLDDVEITSSNYNFDISKDVEVSECPRLWPLRYEPPKPVYIKTSREEGLINITIKLLKKNKPSMRTVRVINPNSTSLAFAPQFFIEGLGKFKDEALSSVSKRRYSFDFADWDDEKVNITVEEEKHFYEEFKLDLFKNIFYGFPDDTKDERVKQLTDIVNMIKTYLSMLATVEFFEALESYPKDFKDNYTNYKKMFAESK